MDHWRSEREASEHGGRRGHVECLQRAPTTRRQSLDAIRELVQEAGFRAGTLEVSTQAAARSLALLCPQDQGELLLVNESGRPGADRLAQELLSAVELGEPRDWQPPVLHVTAIEGTGLDATWEAIADHRAYMEAGALAADRLARQMRELEQQLQQQLFRDRMVTIGDDALRSAAERVLARRSDPFSAINRLAN